MRAALRLSCPGGSCTLPSARTLRAQVDDRLFERVDSSRVHLSNLSDIRQVCQQFRLSCPFRQNICHCGTPRCCHTYLTMPQSNRIQPWAEFLCRSLANIQYSVTGRKGERGLHGHSMRGYNHTNTSSAPVPWPWQHPWAPLIGTDVVGDLQPVASGIQYCAALVAS